MKKIMVSACLLGENCKYSGGNNYNEKVIRYIDGHEVIPVCPEVMGGLPIPRKPAEIVNGIVQNEDGTVVDVEFRRGAEIGLSLAKEKQIDFAILQSRSPSCGCKMVYDGTFSGTKIPGMGIFAKLLQDNGFEVVDLEDVNSIPDSGQSFLHL